MAMLEWSHSVVGMIVLRETLSYAGFAMSFNLPVQIVLVVIASIIAGALWRKPDF
jgi:hypothetical protein